MTIVDERPIATIEKNAWRGKVTNGLIVSTCGGSIASLLALMVLAASGHADRYGVSALLLVAALSLGVGFAANGLRALKRGQTSAGVLSILLVLVWLGFAAAQVVRLAG